MRLLLSVRMQTKITLLFIVLCALPAGVLGWLAVRSQEEQIGQSLQMHRRFSSLIKAEITRRILSYRRLLSAISQMPEMQRMAAPDLSRGLQRVLANDRLQEKGIEGIVVFDRSKSIVASAGVAPTVRGADRVFSESFFDTYGGSPSPVASGQGAPVPLLVDPTAPERVLGPIVEKVSTPQMQLRFLVYGSGEEIVGALVASLSPDYLSRTVNRILDEITEISKKVDIYVLDARDRRIAASREARYGLEPVINPETFQITDPEMRNRTEEPLKSFYTPAWRVVIVPRSAAFEELHRTRAQLERVILLGILVAIVMGLSVTRTITTPLSKLVGSALTIARGNLDHPVTVQSSDEIGELASAFEGMRVNLARSQDALRARIDELATLCDVGRAISSTLDLNQLLHVVLDLVMRIAGAERGSIMLYDEEKQELRIHVARGLPAEIVEGTRVKRGERVAGTVLESERPLLIADPEKSPYFKRLKESRIHPGSLISVPLIAKDKKLGILNISRATPPPLDEKHLELTRAISAQAAIAIENARLYEMAIKDELTKLYIRRYFDQRLREELRRAKRYRAVLTVMLLDIDFFKRFNDTHGHQCGDEILCFVGRIMRECVRNVDIVCRYGGEEFAILCPEQSVEDALIPAGRIRKAVESSHLMWAQTPVRCTVSVGVAGYPQDARLSKDLQKLQEDLLWSADQALYAAKNGGRNMVVAYRELPRDGPPRG